MTKAVSLARSVSDTGLLLDSDLAAIAALSGTTGLLKKTAANTWSLDTTSYLTGITSGSVTTALGYTPENLANKAIANGYASLDSTGKVPTAQLSGFVDQTKPNIRPTLNLDFANSKIVDSRITFTRSTTATYYDAQGVLQYAQPDQPRIDHDPVTGECKGLLIEEQRTNLRDYSDQIQNWSWDAVSVQPNAAIGPDGKMSAAKITALTNDGKISKQASNSAGTHIISVWLKSATGSSFNIGIGSYDVVASSQGFSTLTVTTEWQRFTQVVNCGANAAFYIGGASSFSNPESLYAWGYQVEAGTFATSYIPSTTTFTSRASNATYFDSTGILRLAGTNQPRYGYGYDTTSGKWVSQGLVLEAAATNLLGYSVPSSLLVTGSPNNAWAYNAYGTGSNTSTANTTETTAPDGSYTATKAVLSTGAGTTASDSAPLTYYSNGGITSGTAYTASVWVKAVSGNAGKQIQMRHVRSNVYNKFTLTDSWQRISLTEIATQTNTSLEINLRQGAVNEDGSSSINSSVSFYVWGAQLEAGYVATSYIPTYGATATRAADISSSASTTRAVDSAVIKSSEFTKLNSSTAGTLYGEGTIISGTALVGGAPALVALSNSVNRDTHRFILRRTNMTGDATYAGFNYRLATVINGTSYSIDYSAAEGAQPEWEDSAVHKTIFAVDTTSQQAYGDGISAGITSISIPSFDKLDQVEIGQGGSSSSWNGHIRKIAYYNKRLSNTQLQALTQ